MDLVPSTPVVVAGTGRYDAFPAAAANGSTVLAVWRSGLYHAKSDGMVAKTAISTDGGKTYSPGVQVSGLTPETDAPVAVVWDAKGSRWLMLVLVHASDGSYAAYVTASTDGKAWSKVADVDTLGTSWFYPSDLVVVDGLWVVAGYGQRAGDASWVPFTTTSTTTGKVWTGLAVPSVLPTGISYAEPQLVHLHSGGWLMVIRSGVNVYHQARSKDGVTWAHDTATLGGVSGSPEVAQATDGTLVQIIRRAPTVDDTHGTWLWATSTDEGLSWTLRDDFPGGGRYAMYGGLAPLPDGSVACVYAFEDDPAQLWKSSSVYALVFKHSPLSASVKFAPNGAPYIEILGGEQKPITRVTKDRYGNTVRDMVRWRLLTPEGGGRDFELQQGHSATYLVGERSTTAVIAPILSESMLINPGDPLKSIRARIVTDGDRDRQITSTVTDVPSIASSGQQYPVVTYSGRLGAGKGSTVIRTKREVEKWRLEDCFESLDPLFWSHHPGLGMPDWIAVTGLKEARFAQICPCGCGHDLGDNVGEWRDWTIEWVAQPRPDALALPYRHRIGDTNVPIGQINMTLAET